MKTFYLTAFCILGFVIGSQAQATTTLNQTFSSMNATQIDFEVPSDQIAIKMTKGSRIIVESKIELSTPNERLLQYLVDTKRYELKHSYNAQQQRLTIQRPETKGAVMVKGEEIRETVHYTLYIPQQTTFVAKKTAHKVEG